MQKNTLDIFLEYISKLGYGSSIAKITSLVEKVSSVTNQSINEVIRCSDFREQELSKEKLESIIAELRSVMFLDNNNFKNIKLIKSSKNKSSDIYAENLNRKFDIEVTCLTNTYSRGKDGPSYILDNDKFLREFTGRITTKIDQLKAGVNSYKMIIFTMNRYPEKALTDDKEYRELIKEAYNQSKLSNDYYLGLLTGDVDFIYPNLEIKQI